MPYERKDMNDKFNLMITEYSQLRESERSTRSLLYRIDTFAVVIVSALLVAISVYKMTILVLAAPLIFYLVGFFWHSESMRLLRLSGHLSLLEQAMRKHLHASEGDIPAGFEESVREGSGWLFLMRNNNIIVATAILYGIFYLLFLYLLATSNYDASLRISLLIVYVLFGGAFWGYDLWNNRKYLVPGKEG